MTNAAIAKPVEFDWRPQPEAARFVGSLVDDFVHRNAAAAELATRMRDETGTRFFDWIDHLAVPEDDDVAAKLESLGFEPQHEAGATRWHDEQGLFPDVMTHASPVVRCAVRVESVADCLFAHRLDDRTCIDGPPLAGLRKSLVAREKTSELWVVERHATAGWDAAAGESLDVSAIAAHGEAFRLRRRDFENPLAGFDHAAGLIAAAARDVGVDRACDLFFAAERDYWQSRNRAARVQKARQDCLGLGWANHDHHTYRSSRKVFARLIGVLEQLGFRCRERFYAGAEAGWGAQVLEQPAAGIVIFADVDLTPDEVAVDFAHEGLATSRQLGTVGLWCRLHGEAFLQAGMHHLECQFDFARAQEQLAAEGVKTMPPFTNFDYLKQAFTEGEMWPVAPARIDAALADGCISADDAARFRRDGMLGSHLEILQRDDGYKGFNQTGISEIIRKTDPRRPA